MTPNEKKKRKATAFEKIRAARAAVFSMARAQESYAPVSAAKVRALVASYCDARSELILDDVERVYTEWFNQLVETQLLRLFGVKRSSFDRFELDKSFNQSVLGPKLIALVQDHVLTDAWAKEASAEIAKRVARHKKDWIAAYVDAYMESWADAQSAFVATGSRQGADDGAAFFKGAAVKALAELGITPDDAAALAGDRDDEDDNEDDGEESDG